MGSIVKNEDVIGYKSQGLHVQGTSMKRSLEPSHV